MNTNITKENQLTAQAQIFKALAHPTRLWLLEQMSEQPKCVCEFVAGAEVDFSTISKHLAVLKKAGIVSSHRQGKQIFYQLTMPCLLDSLACMTKKLNTAPL